MILINKSGENGEYMHKIRTNKPVDSAPSGMSVIPANRLNYLVSKCRETLLHTPGNILEVGVYKAGSLLPLAEVLREVCPGYKAYGIDTFSGHPYTDGHTIHPKGKYGDVDIHDVERLIIAKRLHPWVKLFRGKVEEIFEDLHLTDISFAHVDCDLYIPTKYCAVHVPTILNKGGMLYFDDYGHEHCLGATRAVEEVFSKNQIREVYIADDNTCWSCYIQI